MKQRITAALLLLATLTGGPAQASLGDIATINDNGVMYGPYIVKDFHTHPDHHSAHAEPLRGDYEGSGDYQDVQDDTEEGDDDIDEGLLPHDVQVHSSEERVPGAAMGAVRAAADSSDTALPLTAMVAPPVTAKPLPQPINTPGIETPEPSIAPPSTAPLSTAQPSTAQPSTAQPSTAQPSTAQPSTAQPSTAQPSTAQPSTSPPSTAPPSRASPSTTPPSTAGGPQCQERCSDLLASTTLVMAPDVQLIREGEAIQLQCWLSTELQGAQVFEDVQLRWLFEAEHPPASPCSLDQQPYLLDCEDFSSVHDDQDRNSTHLTSTLTLAHLQPRNTGRYACQVVAHCCESSVHQHQLERRLKVWRADYTQELLVMSGVAAVLVLMLVVGLVYQRKQDNIRANNYKQLVLVVPAAGNTTLAGGEGSKVVHLQLDTDDFDSSSFSSFDSSA